MCGLVGFFIGRNEINSSKGQRNSLDHSVLKKMSKTLIHRGPDDSETWVDTDFGIGLGHRRLSIIDLTEAGQQPMHSHSGRYIIAFNGEIYNHLELRVELGDINWKGHSDTETLLAAIEKWGLEASLKKIVGMFAIALWDNNTKELTLARDRFGEKPLYFGWACNESKPNKFDFIFGSELKALRAYPGVENSISTDALALYMRYTYIPAPYSIYENIYKLEPGCMLKINSCLAKLPKLTMHAPLKEDSLTINKWWSLSDDIISSTNNHFSDESEAIFELDKGLKASVKLQSLSDVPLGAFLSGGVDSSLIVALMQQQAMNPIKTFTIGFEESNFDESPYAKAVAKYLSTDHNELIVTSTETMAVIPQLPAMYDEPFADSSQIPTHLVCKAARQQVTVALSGDGGDELFGGYNRYFWGPRIWNRLSWLPYPLRQAIGIAINSISINKWDILGKSINSFLSKTKGIERVGDKAHKLAVRLKGVKSMDDLYFSLVSEWQSIETVVKGQFSSKSSNHFIPLSLSDEERMMYRDSVTYLPDDILCKVDRASMAASLEVRAPFLDQRVSELAWQLPLNMKIRGNEGKWVLRQILYKYVPRDLIERPKAGFGIPVGQWLRGPLRDWAEALLDEKRLIHEGYFYPLPIRQKWTEHLNGMRDHTASLWTVLMFQAWLEENS